MTDQLVYDMDLLFENDGDSNLDHYALAMRTAEYI